MAILFILFICALLLCLPLHFLSVNHTKLNKMFRPDIAEKFGTILGFISGWGYFICLMALWVAPQPRFAIPLFPVKLFEIPFLTLPIYSSNLLYSILFIILSIYLGFAGVKGTSLKVSETHRPTEVITRGIYSYLRHPQYLGAIMAHIGFSILLSGLYAFLSTPIIILYNYLISWKEEKELIKEFGEEYQNYKKNVPMFLPRILHLKEKKDN